MSGRQIQTRVFDRCLGRDGSTPSEIAIPPGKAKEARNVDFWRASIARKRNGCENAFTDTTGESFTGQIMAGARFVPGADETAAQLWLVDSAATPVVQRLPPGTAWSTPTLKDNISTRPQDVVFVPFNGKLYMFYDSTQDRLHVWDGSTVRRVGLATPAAATVANSAPAGTYAAILRYYKIIYTDGTRWSEASPAVSFTPDGAHTAAVITKPAAINEGETHWKIYTSLDGVLYFYLTEIVVGTTTYSDTTDYSSIQNISNTDPIPVVGANIVPTSAKYGMVDGNRLVMAGSWESQNVNRIWFTPRLGSSDYADDERIPDTVDFSNWIDLDEKDGDSITGVAGPIQGMPIVFKNRQIWKLRPTLDATEPYAPLPISKSVGGIRHHAIVMAEDENGDPALYFLSHRGPYRLGMRGLQYCGKDVEDLWLRMNVDATTVSAYAIWHEDKHRVEFGVSLDTSNAPSLTMVFDVNLGEADEDDNVRGGWSTFDGTVAEVNCGVMFSETFASSTSRVLKPYLGSQTAATLLRSDTGELDLGVEYAGYLTWPEQHLAGLTHYFTFKKMTVLGNAWPHTLQVDLLRDYGCEPRTDTVRMAAETGDQTRVQKTYEALFQADAKSVGMRIGDICPVSYPWTVDALVMWYEPRLEQGQS
jgi:hypothetical protein